MREGWVRWVLGWGLGLGGCMAMGHGNGPSHGAITADSDVVAASWLVSLRA